MTKQFRTTLWATMDAGIIFHHFKLEVYTKIIQPKRNALE